MPDVCDTNLLPEDGRECRTHHERLKTLEGFAVGENGRGGETISPQGIANHAIEVERCPFVGPADIGSQWYSIP